MTVASMYQWLGHRSKVSLAMVACAAWRGAAQKKAVQAVHPVSKYRWTALRIGTMSDLGN